MKLFDFTTNKNYAGTIIPEAAKHSGELFIFCKASETKRLEEFFRFDESTLLECANLDESVRYMSFESYDFISLVHMEKNNDDITLKEINMYVSKGYLVLVMPENESPRLQRLEQSVLGMARNPGEKSCKLNRLYMAVLNAIITDYSDLLEDIEDNIEALSESITEKTVDERHLEMINKYRKITYTTQKQLRALSSLGEQILVDENRIIDKKLNRYFISIDSRLKKLQGFAESLYQLSAGLLSTYDSKLSMKTNDIVTRLTILTLFFAPLTVITGIYGMNFDFMPELKTRFGYPLTLAVMAAVCAALYLFMKKKKWL